MINFGLVPAGAVLPVFFATYGKTNGESITLTGLAVTDIEIYKGTSITQRASDAGYALIDTDGIDIDSLTGIHAFSIDTGDNTDAGFYVAGSFYTVVVSAVTVDSQVVNFIAATFRLGTAEGVTGQPKVDVASIAGSAVSTTSAQLGVNVVNVGGTVQTAGDIIGDTNDIQTRLPAALVSGRIDASVGAIAANAITAASMAADASAEIADAVWDEDATGHQTGGTFGQAIGDPGADVTTIYQSVVTDATGTNVAADIIAIKSETASILTDTAEIGAAGAGLTAIDLPDQTMNITGNITGNLSGSVGSVTGNVGGSVASLTTNNDKTGYTLSATGSAALTEGYAADGAAATLPQLLYMIWSMLAEANAVATTITTKKLDGSTSAMTFTIDDATTPTSITRAT